MKYHRCTNNTKVQDDICYHHIFEKITNEMKDNMIAIKEIKKTIKIKTDKDSYLFNINGMMHSIFKKPKIVIFHPKNGWLKLTIFNIKQFMSVIEENHLEDGIFYDNNNEIKSIVKKEVSKVSIIGNGIIRNFQVISNILKYIEDNKLEISRFEISEIKILIIFKEMVDDKILENLHKTIFYVD